MIEGGSSRGGSGQAAERRRGGSGSCGLVIVSQERAGRIQARNHGPRKSPEPDGRNWPIAGWGRARNWRGKVRTGVRRSSLSHAQCRFPRSKLRNRASQARPANIFIAAYQTQWPVRRIWTSQLGCSVQTRCETMKLRFGMTSQVRDSIDDLFRIKCKSQLACGS